MRFKERDLSSKYHMHFSKKQGQREKDRKYQSLQTFH